MNEEFCFFDGNHLKVKSFVTLAASTYDPLLQKQVALAILECKHEDKENIEVFRWMFNSAFKEVNGIREIFSPTGFCTDMATANFNGLVKIYGEEVLEKVKGCEFHFRDSINRKASTLGEHNSKFKEISLSMLTSTTPEAHINALKNMQDFIDKGEKLVDLQHWFNWWDNRRELIFKAFTSKVTPESYLAEVIHAGCKKRDKMGVSLLKSCLFDVRDSVLLESRVASLSRGSFKARYGPNQEGARKRTIEKMLI